MTHNDSTLTKGDEQPQAQPALQPQAAQPQLNQSQVETPSLSAPVSQDKLSPGLIAIAKNELNDLTQDFLREYALSLPEVTEEPHFEKTSFRVKKKIFVTYDTATNRACFKFSESDQDLFSQIDSSVIYPVPNKWGKQGWTIMELDRLENEILKDAMRTAYCEVAPKKLAELINKEK